MERTGKTSNAHDRLIKALDSLPPMSAGVGKLLSNLGKRNTNMGDYVNTLERDPVLAARVLQLANSAAYARTHRIESIQRAVGLVGTSTLRRHALSWTIGGLLKRFQSPAAWSMTRFTMHSTATAALTDVLCDELPVRNADAAYLSGLIHDIGKFVIFNGTPDLAEQIALLHRVSSKPLVECEREYLGTDHAALSSMVAEKWGLSNDICDAVLHHHSAKHRDEGGKFVPLSLVLQKADQFANALGLSLVQEAAENQPAALEWPEHPREVGQALDAFQKLWTTLYGGEEKAA